MSLYFYKASLIKVIDGDTFDAMVDLGFNVSLKVRVRLSGIDAPESRTRDKEEKRRGLKAKERLRGLLQEKPILIESKEWGKYGRCLGIIRLTEKGKPINDILVKEGYAIYKKY